jgi:membrane protease YdiL (CAAX protease family)
MAAQKRKLVKIWTALGFGLLAPVIIGSVGVIWAGLILTNVKITPAAPWCAPAMAVVLWLMWQYLDGKGPPNRTSAERKQLLRANHVSGQAFKWSLLAGVSAIIALAGYWIILFQLFRMPANRFLPNFPTHSFLTVAVIIMGSLVSPITEESTVRGYFQTVLEQEFRPFLAIAISSVVFALVHVNQGLQWPKLLVYFLAGVVFGAIAYFNNSILPCIFVHIVGDLTFFLFVWPHDAMRTLVWQNGTDLWFWIHLAQAVLFTALSIAAFRRLDQVTRSVKRIFAGKAWEQQIPNSVR